MADTLNLTVVKLEKRIFELERILQILDGYIESAEASFVVLRQSLEASNRLIDTEIIIILRAIMWQRGLAPKHLTKLHLVKALLEDEYGVKLHSNKKAAERPNRPR